MSESSSPSPPSLPLLPALPAGYDEAAKPTGLSTPVSAWDEHDVLVLSTVFAEGSPEDEEASPASEVKRRGPKSKAERLKELADRDPYRLLELDELRWRASADDIKKAYRRMVLKHHPDKQMGADAAEQRVAKKQAEGEEGEEERPSATDDKETEADEMFKAITEAFELLSDGKRRRDFDSLDDFDDSIPPKDYEPKEHGEFFGVFGPVFERNSRWSELPNAPLLGAAEGAFDEVAAFYNFWFDFKSWRDFADADEYDMEEAGFREERRWMERQNDKLRAKKRKVEAARIAKLVELAYANDPRVQAEKTRAKEAKAAGKAERAAALQRDKEAAAAAAAAKEAARVEAERVAAEQEKAEAAERKRAREKQAKAARKGRARLRALVSAEGAAANACGAVELEMLCTRLSAEALEELCGAVEAMEVAEKRVAKFAEVVRAEQTAQEREEALAAERAAAERAAAGAGEGVKLPWTEDELTLLVKAANKFPGGVADRWERMAEFINHFASPSNGRTADEVTIKVKERRRELDVKKAAANAERDRQEGRTPTKSPAPPPAAPPATKAEPSKPAAAAAKPPPPAAAAASAGVAAAPANDWSDEQQRALETALKKFPASVGAERWDRIAENVPGKTKGECVRRYKEIVAALKAKKETAAAS